MSFKRPSAYRSSRYRFFWYLSAWCFTSSGAWLCMGGSVKISIIFIALILLLASAPGMAVKAAESDSTILPGNPLEGSQLFSEKGCLRCHAINGVGGVGGPDLGQGILKRSFLDIAGVMWNHSP